MLSREIKQVSNEKGLSREELAKMIGRSGLIVCRYERGDTISIKVATKFAVALEVSLYFLLSESSITRKISLCLNRLECIENLLIINRLELLDVLKDNIRILIIHESTLSKMLC